MKAIKFNIIEITNCIQSHTSKHFAVIDLANMFCSVTILTASHLQFAFKSKETQFTFTWLPMEYLNSTAISHNLDRK